MPKLSRRPLIVALALAPVLALALLAYSCRRHPVIAPDWAPGRLHEALTDAGLALEGHAVPQGIPYQQQGYYLRRPGDGRSWGELARHGRNPAASMRDFVVVTTALPGTGPLANSDPQEGRLQIAHFILYGDPALLREILEALR